MDDSSALAGVLVRPNGPTRQHITGTPAGRDRGETEGSRALGPENAVALVPRFGTIELLRAARVAPEPRFPDRLPCCFSSG